MSLTFRLKGDVTAIGRSLDLGIAPGAPFDAVIDIDPNIDDEAAVTELIGTYPGAIQRAEVSIGGVFTMALSRTVSTKIIKRTADPYAYMLNAELVSPDGPAVARGNFEVVLQRRTELTPADDTDDLAPPVMGYYSDRRWRIWLVLRGAPPSKIEGRLRE